METNLSPEIRLMLAGALTPLQSNEIDRLRELCVQPLDWAGVGQLARRHGLAAILYTNLNRHAPGLIPAGAKDALKKDAQENHQMAMLLYAEIIRLDKILSPAGVSICPIKGPQLSKQLYGDVGLRATRDIDLLISEEQVWPADKILTASGYRRTNPRFPLSPVQ